MRKLERVGNDPGVFGQGQLSPALQGWADFLGKPSKRDERC